MKEIKCPNCHEVFSVDENDYAQIVQQVRTNEFENELNNYKKQMEAKAKNDLEILKLKQEETLNKQNSDKQLLLAKKDQEIQALKQTIANSEKEIALAVSNALREKEQEIERLKGDLKNSESDKQLAVINTIQQKDKELSAKLTKIAELEGRISNQENIARLKEEELKRGFEKDLKAKDELIEYYKDFKARLSTKMIGESLEQHCLNAFNQLRMTAFPTAYFEKDNDAATGSKGDFIFRDFLDGIEYISIMFEMKNEMDTTSTKHKNEDFFKELDKDRREKGCEYAVLVSLLEADNEYYNAGIVDVSYKYEKMYVIRPQFFIPLITLLKNAAANSLAYRQELEIVKNQQIDISNFEANMQAFKEGFGRNYRIASDKFKTAIDEIDKTITHLQKTKDALISSENNLRLANNKSEDLSIKKLTKNAPSVRKMFEDLK